MKRASGAADPDEDARDHQDACHRLGVGIEIGIAHLALGQQVVVQEHGAEALHVLQLLQAQEGHGNGNEQLQRAHRDDGVEGQVADGQSHQQAEGEQRDDRLIAGLVLLFAVLAHMRAQFVIAADPRTADEDLRRGLHSCLSWKASVSLRVVSQWSSTE